jgi:hypothetical protein
MRPKRESWFNRVLDRVLAEGMSEYELAHFGRPIRDAPHTAPI